MAFWKDVRSSFIRVKGKVRKKTMKDFEKLSGSHFPSNEALFLYQSIH